MSTLTLPHAVDALATIATHMGVLPFGPLLPETRRAEIVRNVLGPVVMLTEAVRLAAAAGPDEEAVLMQFVASLHAEHDRMKRDRYFAELIDKLNKHRPSNGLPH